MLQADRCSQSRNARIGICRLHRRKRVHRAPRIRLTDHAKASYGDRGCELFTVIVDGIHYAAKLNSDGIVMLCNTACSKSLDKAIEIVKRKLGDPIKYQADKTARFLANPTEKKITRAHRAPRGDNKHFLPRVEVHTTTWDTDKVRNAVKKYSKDMEVLNQYLAADVPDVEDVEELAGDGDAQHIPRTPSKASVVDTKGIRVTKVHFEKVPLKTLAPAVGVNEFGDEIPKNEPVPAS